MAQILEKPITTRLSINFLRQVKQVGMTYVTQRSLRFATISLGLFALPMIFFSMVLSRIGSEVDSSIESNATFMVLMFLGMLTQCSVAYMVGQAKMQCAHSRACVTPRFFPAHLAVLSTIVVTLMVFVPLAVASFAQLEPLSLIAFAFAVSVPCLWGIQLNRLSLYLMSLAIFFCSSFTDWGFNWWVVAASQHRAEHAVIIMAGVLLIAAWFWRISRLTEEMDDYENIFQMLVARRAGAETIEQRRIVSTQMQRSFLMGWVGDRWHGRLGGYRGGSHAGLARLLSYGFGPAPVFVQCLFMGATFLALGLFFSQTRLVADTVGSGAFPMLIFPIIFAVFFSGQMAGESLAQRRPRIANEMLFPLQRAQLVDGLFSAAIRNSLVVWLIMNSVVAIVARLIGARPSPVMLVIYLLLSASATFAALSLSLRTSVWPSQAKRLAVLLAYLMAFVPLIFFQRFFGILIFLLAAVLLIAIGAVFIRSARRAWLELELGATAE